MCPIPWAVRFGSKLYFPKVVTTRHPIPYALQMYPWHSSWTCVDLCGCLNQLIVGTSDGIGLPTLDHKNAPHVHLALLGHLCLELTCHAVGKPVSHLERPRAGTLADSPSWGPSVMDGQHQSSDTWANDWIFRGFQPLAFPPPQLMSHGATMSFYRQVLPKWKIHKQNKWRCCFKPLSVGGLLHSSRWLEFLLHTVPTSMNCSAANFLRPLVFCTFLKVSLGRHLEAALRGPSISLTRNPVEQLKWINHVYL